MKRFFIIIIVPILMVIGYFVVGTLMRHHPEVTASTRHPTLNRESCIDCHAPIAEEWRQSFHYKSLTGPFWTRINNRGFATLFETLRVPCKNCHAPANILDLPEGSNPALRRDDLELGVDCVSCHVSKQGITGPGRNTDAPHEKRTDKRFLEPELASTGLCAHCHEEQEGQGRVVTAWRHSKFAAEGVTCVDCHMPETNAPITTSGAPRLRRSHRFPGDKDPEMLSKALNASVEVTEDKRALVRIINDRVGHDFPAAGTNSLIVKVTIEDGSGQVLYVEEHSFGTIESIPGYLDFWPFHQVSRIPYGEHRDIVAQLPATHGKVIVQFRYRDWFAITDKDVVFATITRNY
ncbi:MAG: multiheme c-type cytochrome [Gammaproteobacteria bacterium]|nr:multiheme c-type cytochrome [Gammaproteobacteria bacterium]